MKTKTDAQFNSELKAGGVEFIAELKRTKQKQLIMTIFTMVITMAVTVAAVYAWFAQNNDVNGNGITVDSARATASLFIEKGDLKSANPTTYQANYKYTVSVNEDLMSGGLYPISLEAGADTNRSAFKWWYPTGWDNGQASTYAYATGALTVHATNTDAYTYQYNDTKYIAYNIAQYTVYCNEGGELDVYLATGTSIELTASGTNVKQLDKALRVGILVDDVLKCVYAPAETGTGNSKNSVSGLNMVYSTTGVKAPTYNGIENYQAKESSGKVVAGTTPLFRASYTGNVVSVIVWLEGTDAETNYGKSDNASSVSVGFHLVGIE